MITLSEHTSSLSEEKNRIDFSTDLNSVEKLHLLSQLYINQLKEVCGKGKEAEGDYYR